MSPFSNVSSRSSVSPTPQDACKTELAFTASKVEKQEENEEVDVKKEDEILQLMPETVISKDKADIADPLSSDSSSEASSGQEFNVQSIENHRFRGRKLELFIRWENYDQSDNTWEPASKFRNQPMLMAMILIYLQEKHVKTSSIVPHFKALIDFIVQLEPHDPMLLSKLTAEPLEEKNDLVQPLTEEKVKSMRSKLESLNRDMVTILKNFHGSLTAFCSFITTRFKLIDNYYQAAGEINQREGEHAEIEVENLEDNDPFPKNFVYIPDYMSLGRPVDFVSPKQYCHCNERCSTDQTCCGFANGMCHVYKDGKLNRRCREVPILECNDRCSCGPSCANRVVQKGIQEPMVIFKTKNKGWGVKSKEKIFKGSFVLEYIGEVLSEEEARKRKDSLYLFEVKPSKSIPAQYVIDAANYGNIGRFVNHSCNPNLSVHYVYINNQNIGAPRLAFFAKRDIPPNTELTINYSEQYGLGTTAACLCNSKDCSRKQTRP